MDIDVMRRELVAALTFERNWAEAEEMINEYTHALAEKLRNHPDSRKYGRGKWAADLIYPEGNQ